MGIRRTFSRGGNDILLTYFFRLLTIWRKWTFTKRFTMQTGAPFASFLKSYSGWRCTAYEFAKSVYCLSQLLLNWCIIQYCYHCKLQKTESELDLNYLQPRLWCSHQFVQVKSHFAIFSLKCFQHIGYQKCFFFSRTAYYPFFEHFLQISHNEQRPEQHQQ